MSYVGYAPKDGFPYYYNLVRNKDCRSLFASASAFSFLDTIEERKAAYRYAPDKWSIREVVGHMADHKRIKMYRAFLLSRKQEVTLWGYEQDALVANSRFEEQPFRELRADLKNVRKASSSFVNGLSDSQLKLKGMANQYEVTLEEFLISVIGHQFHHIRIIKERYL